jgi:predicted transcriptional regulator
MPVKVAFLSELIRWFDSVSALLLSLADKSRRTESLLLRIGLQSSGDALKAMAWRASTVAQGFDKDDSGCSAI